MPFQKLKVQDSHVWGWLQSDPAPFPIGVPIWEPSSLAFSTLPCRTKDSLALIAFNPFLKCTLWCSVISCSSEFHGLTVNYIRSCSFDRVSVCDPLFQGCGEERPLVSWPVCTLLGTEQPGSPHSPAPPVLFPVVSLDNLIKCWSRSSGCLFVEDISLVTRSLRWLKRFQHVAPGTPRTP